MRAAFALIAVLATAAFAAPAAAQTSGSTVPFSTTLPAPIDRAHLIAMFQRTTNVLDYGADPTGKSDSAPAFRAAMGSNRRIVVPPGTYLFSSTQAAPCCAFDPPAVLVQGLSGFELDGYGATIIVDPSVALSTAFHFDKDSNFTVRGLTIQGARSGLTAGQENTAFGLSSDVGFSFRDIHLASGFGGNGAGIAGDWLVNGVFADIRMDAVGHCFDVAYLKNVRIAGVAALGTDTNGASGTGQVGQTCLSVITDPPNAAQNNTGVAFTETKGVTVTGFDESNFQTGAYITTGTDYRFAGNRWHDNPGLSGAAGLGMWIRNDATVSAGVPPQDITVADVFENNGAAVSGYGLLLSSAKAAAGDIIAHVDLIGSSVINNTATGIGTDGTTGFSGLNILADQFSGSAQTTAINASAAAVASAVLQGGALTLGGSLVLPNNVALQGRDSGGAGRPLVFADPSNELVLRPASQAADVVLSDFNGNVLAQFFAGSSTFSQPATFSGGVAERSNPVSSQSGTAYTFATTDCGTTVRFLASAAVTATVPTGLPVGCRIKVTQVNSTGPVTFVADSGETIRSYNSATTTNGQYAVADVLIDSAATFELSGQVH